MSRRADEGSPRGSRDERLARTFVELAGTLVSTFDVDEFLTMLCHRTHEVLDVQAAGMLLESRSGELRLSSASTEDAASVDLFELQAQEGPCYEAYLSGERVVELDLEHARERWPTFTVKALGCGFRAVYGLPLRVGDERLGAMNLFRTRAGEFDDADVAAAQALADVATLGLIVQRRVTEAETRADQLQRALDSRVVIEQAKGALAERAGITTHEAYERIRRHARTHRGYVRSVANEVIEGTLDLG